MSSQKRPAGNLFVGYVGIENNDDKLLEQYIPQLGKLNNITEIIEEYDIEEVIIAIETREHDRLNNILTILENLQISIWEYPNCMISYRELLEQIRYTAVHSSKFPTD